MKRFVNVEPFFLVTAVGRGGMGRRPGCGGQGPSARHEEVCATVGPAWLGSAQLTGAGCQQIARPPECPSPRWPATPSGRFLRRSRPKAHGGVQSKDLVPPEWASGECTESGVPSALFSRGREESLNTDRGH